MRFELLVGGGLTSVVDVTQLLSAARDPLVHFIQAPIVKVLKPPLNLACPAGTLKSSEELIFTMVSPLEASTLVLTMGEFPPEKRQGVASEICPIKNSD